jgi:hypothetical protein
MLSAKVGYFRATAHPEAADWRDRVIANGGTVSASTFAAVETFCRSIDAAGLRSLLWRVSPMAGGNLSAALVPLYRSNVALGLQGNATDTNSNFVSTDYAEGSGLIGNGSSKALNTGLPTNFRNGRHIGMVPYTLGTTAFRYYMGVRNGGTPANGYLYTIFSDSPTANVGCYAYADDAAAVGGSTGGAAVARRLVLANNVLGTGGTSAMYSNGVAFSNVGAGFNTTATTPIGIFAVRQAAGTFGLHSNARLSGYTIGANMTASEVASYNAIWTTLLTALGRS